MEAIWNIGNSVAKVVTSPDKEDLDAVVYVGEHTICAVNRNDVYKFIMELEAVIEKYRI